MPGSVMAAYKPFQLEKIVRIGPRLPMIYEMEENVIQNDEIGADIQVSETPFDGSEVSVPVEVATDQVVPVYSSADDDIGLPIAYDIFLDDDNMLMSADDEEEQQTTEYSAEEILMQINDNIVDGMALTSALLGVLLGVLVGAEVFKIWLQS